jgi:hypothetical protein
MRFRTFRGAVAAGLAAVAAACITVQGPQDTPPSWQPSEYRKTVDLKAGDTVAVEHTLGNIVITGWDRDSVEIVAKVRKADAGDKHQVHLYSGEEIEPAIDVRQADGILRIRTKSLGGPWTTTAMDYAIRVPASVSLRAIRLETGNVSISDVYGRIETFISSGGLTVRNYSGFLKANLSSGPADVELLDVHGEDAVEITSLQGDIVLRLQAGAGVHLMAEAPKGEISSEFDLGVKLPVPSLTAKLGDGAAPVSLKALRGNIRIVRTQ